MSKEHINVCVVGHVDAGKSTTTGHLLFKLGGVDQRELDKLRKTAEDLGKKSFEFAYVMDTQKDERERGITIKSTAKEFFTEKYHYTIVDCPGHKDYLGNMISGSSTTEAALLMLPAAGFETAIAKGDENGKLEGQTRQHARLLNFTGIKQVIVCINKMDDPTINFSEARFNEIRDEALHMLVQAGYGVGKSEKERLESVKKTIPIIPISGLKGLNLIDNKCAEMSWYNGFSVERIDGTITTGHTVYDALNNYILLPKRDDKKPLRMPVSQIIPLPIGTVVTGRIEQGVLKPGDNVTFCPSMITGKAFSIEAHGRALESAHSGDNIGINIKGMEKGRLPKRGDIMFLTADKPAEVYEYTAQVVVQDHPGELKVGYCPNIMVRTAHAACRMTEIKWRLGKETNKVQVKEGELLNMIKQGDAAEVVFRPQKPLYLETYASCEGLGRIALMDSNKLVALGKVISVTYYTPEIKQRIELEAKAASDAKRLNSKKKK